MSAQVKKIVVKVNDDVFASNLSKHYREFLQAYANVAEDNYLLSLNRGDYIHLKGQILAHMSGIDSKYFEKLDFESDLPF